LSEDAQEGARPPFERRKLRTVLTECGKRGSARTLADIEARFAEAGIYTEPKLADSALRLNDWVWFSTGPFHRIQPSSRERPIFSGLFRRASEVAPSEPGTLQGQGARVGARVRLPDGRRIDLLCQERTKSGTRSSCCHRAETRTRTRTIEQVMSYIDALKQLYPSRSVRAIIVSGREDQVASVRLGKSLGTTSDGCVTSYIQ